MLYLLDKNVRTVRWNGEPLHEAISAIVKESMNGDFILTVKYPISDTGIYKRIKEDMLIKCPTPVLGPQLFRIKKPVENNDQLEITAYHITDDIMQRSVKPVQVANQTCSIALSQMVQNVKTDLGDFSFTSDIQDRRTFNMTETENIYSVLLDGKHSIIGTWEGELVRDNFSLTVKKNRGENRGIVITTHKNLKSYQRSKNSQNVITRIHARSTFKPEGSEHETTIKVTVDSPLINSYPYINEKEYENNNLKTVEDLKKWAQAKFTNEGIDKVSDSIKLEAYELDGQVAHLGDTVNLKSLKHNVDIFKKAIAYEYDGLKEEYISLEFDDKPGFGGSGVSNGLSNVASTILGVTYSAQEIAFEKAAKNADLAFEQQSNQLKKVVEDGIELIKAKTEEDKKKLSDEINRRFQEFNPSGFEEAKAKAEEALKKAGASSDLAEQVKGLVDTTKQSLDDFKSQAYSQFVTSAEFSGVLSTAKTELKKYVKEETDEKTSAIRETITNSFVAKSTYLENVEGINQRFENIKRDNEAKLADYKQGIDGRFANIASQMVGKANQIDFQRVRETSQLYERILGNTDNGIADNVARMAMTSQLFQVEVAKNVGDSRNFVRNADFREGKKNWRESNIAGLHFNYEHSMQNRNKAGVHIYGSSINERFFGLQQTFKIVLKKSDKITLSFLISKDGDSTYSGIDVGLHYRQNGVLKSQKWRDIQNNEITGGVYKKITLNFELPNDIDEINLMLYGQQGKSINIYISEIKLETGSQATSFTLAPEDTEEAVKTVQTQVAGSYAINNLNSAGDLINGINLGANGNNRIIGRATHITGDTLIDNAVIKSAMIDKLKTANFEAGSVTTNILGAEAVTAEKVKFDTAFIQQLVSQQAFIDELFAKQATITKIQSIDFTGNHIKGGRITSLNGQTVFDLQSGWIEMNQEAVGIRNRFDGKPLQFLIFGQGSINGVPSAYTQLMSNRNGQTGIEHTSAGIQIWNGRLGNNVQTAITFYGKLMDFMPNSQGGGVSLNTETRVLSGMNDVTIKGVSLSDILDNIYDNFRNLDHDGNYSRGYYPRWR
nr:MAG TPA: Neck appendage protein [Caudoviricetes sp.]